MSEAFETIRRIVFDLSKLPARILIVIGISGFLAVCSLTLLPSLNAEISASAIAATMTVAVFVFSTFALVLGIGQVIGERFRRILDFTAFGHECWAHVVTQRDGRTTTQIVCDLHVSDRTDDTRLLTDFQLVRPRTRARLFDHSISVRRRTATTMAGIRSRREAAPARGHLIVDADLDREITRRGISVEIAEQDGHRRRLKFPDARIHSRSVVPRLTAPTAFAVRNVGNGA
jgi:hypothetical protein